MYQATVCRLTDLRKHPKADKLQVGLALGYNVIVGINNNEDELGVVFPSDGRLSHKMLMANRLYRKDPATGEEMGGYFEPNGRVKAIKLRGAKSEAFWTPLTSLSWAGSVDNLNIGDTFTELNGELICEKYYTPATVAAMKNANKQKKKGLRPEDYAPEFNRHFDTGQLRDAIYFIIGSEVAKEYIICEKIHGASGRTGNVLWTKKTLWQRVLSHFRLYKDKYRLVTGTRKVVLDPDKMHLPDMGYYAGTNFRAEIHKSLEGKLHPGEILYYEIVGYSKGATMIMPPHGLNKKALSDSGIPKKELEQYGDRMEYTYGCNPGGYKVYVYRVVQDGVDLHFHAMQNRCEELGLETVPYLGTVTYEPGMTAEEFLLAVESFSRGNSTLDESHIKEGVCLRYDNPEFNRPQILKYKGFLFSALEGIRKNTDDYIDLEEVG